MKFGAVCAFVAVWVVVVYAPLAHMVWGGDGSLIGDMIGALDFAGGDVVHTSSGLTGLILCLMLGRRKGFAAVSYTHLYGKAPGNMDKEIVAKVAGDAEILDPKIAPGTLVTTTYDECAAEIGDLAQSEEDVLMYALFPNEARTYLRCV